MPDATTITTTLGALSMSEPALERLASEKLPFQTAYRLSKLKKAVAEEVKHFYEERNTLVKKYGSTNGKGPEDITVQPTSEHWPAFVADVTELANVEVTIPLWPIDLTKIENLTIAAKDLELLEPLLKVEDVPAETPVPPVPPTGSTPVLEACMLRDVLQWAETVDHVTTSVVLALLLYGGAKRWWAFGYQLVEAEKRMAEAKTEWEALLLSAQRREDEWKALALAEGRVASEAIGLARRS